MLPIRWIAVFLGLVRFEVVCSDAMNQLRQDEATNLISHSPGFYGYDMSLLEVNHRPSLVVGSPPPSPASGHGSFDNCQIIRHLKNLTTTINVQCSKLPRAISGRSGDNMGQSVSTNPATGEVLACSTTSVQKCESLLTLPGYCYHTTPDVSTTPTWKSIDHSSTRGCPIKSTIDVLFILDGSGSIDANQFRKIKAWTTAVTETLKVDEGIAKVAVMQFGTRVQMEIQFNSFSNLKELQAAIQKIPRRGGGTYMVTALTEAKKVFAKSDRFGNKKNKQIMIMLTDGDSSQHGVLAAARKVRDMGVATYAVGVGTGYNKKTLQELATGTSSDDRVYEVDNFDKLDSIVGDLQQQINQYIQNEGAGNLTVEFAQAGFDVAFSKNRSITSDKEFFASR